MALHQRLRQIEKSIEKAGIGKQRISFIVVCESGATEEQQEKAIAEYKANNPNYLENDINYVNVPHGNIQRSIASVATTQNARVYNKQAGELY